MPPGAFSADGKTLTHELLCPWPMSDRIPYIEFSAARYCGRGASN